MGENKQQELILESKSKRIVVLACPGSGKTTTLTKKIIGLYKSGVSLKRILSVTFTRKAAQEMYERIAKEIPVSRSEQRNICTLHSLGCRILYTYKDLVGLKDDYSVAIKSEKVEVISEIFNEENLPEEKISSFLSFVSSVKNGFVLNEGNYSTEQFDLYVSKMIERNLIDIDDYIYLPVKILNSNIGVRTTVSNRYDYIYVDEYQDINKIQNEFLDLLINEKTNVLYVGDDDQSIYEFRGSNPNYILEKSSENSGFDVYFLTTNYRSQKNIVELSKKVLSGLSTKKRREKIIIADKTTSSIKPIRNIPFPSKEAEINYVVDEIYRLITQSFVEPKEIAVLCRYSSRKYSTGIPHPELSEIGNRLKVKGIDASTSLPVEGDVKTSKQVKELCKYLTKLSAESFDPTLLNLVRVNAYKKSKFVELLDLINHQYNSLLSAEEDFPTLISKIIDMNVELAVANMQKRLKTILNTFAFCYEQYTAVHNGTMPSEIISSLMSIQLEEDSLQESDRQIYEYAISFSESAEREYEGEKESEYCEIIKDMEAFLYQQDKNENKNCVRLLTGHQSKGLQFDVVFVVGLEAGGFPSNRETLDEQNLDNERRLFYVCITRARELLYLSSNGYATDQSKELADKTFIYNLPATYFDNQVNSFDSISFTHEENSGMERRIKASEKIIDQLESEQYEMFLELEKAKSTIKLLEEKNKEISKNDKETIKNLLRIKELKERIDVITEQSKGKDTYIEELNKRVGNLNKVIESQESEISNLKNNDSDYKEKYFNLSKELLRFKEEKENLIKSHNSLIEKFNTKDKENDLLRKTIKDIKEKAKLEEETNKFIVNVNTAINRINTSKIDFVYDRIFEFPDNVVSKNVKDILKRLFKIFVLDKKYPKIGPRFETGLSNFQDYIEACRDFLNGRCDRDVFASRLNSASYKTSLFSIVRGIMAAQSNSADILDRGKEFGVYPFLKAYVSPDNAIGIYGKLAKNYIAKSSKDSKKLSKELAERMRISYAVGNVSNHILNSKNSDPNIAEFQSIVKEFLARPSEKYYSIFSAFFEFIDLHIGDDLLMLHVKN